MMEEMLNYLMIAFNSLFLVHKHQLPFPGRVREGKVDVYSKCWIYFKVSNVGMGFGKHDTGKWETRVDICNCGVTS